MASYSVRSDDVEFLGRLSLPPSLKPYPKPPTLVDNPPTRILNMDCCTLGDTDDRVKGTRKPRQSCVAPFETQ